MPEISISNIFHTSWDTLRKEKGGNQVIITMRYLQVVRATLLQESFTQFGYYVKILLKSLIRKDSPLPARSLGGGGPLVSADQLVDIYHDLKFLHEPWYFFPLPIVKLESNSPLPRGVSASGGRGVLHAPDEKLSNITYSNWKFADAKFTKYLCHIDAEEQDLADIELNKLMACLYIPCHKEFPPERGAVLRSFSEGGRGVWHESLIDLHTPILAKKLKPWEKLLAAETFGHIRTYIVQREEYLFPQENSTKKKSSPLGEMPEGQRGSQTGGSPVYTGQLWQDLHYDLADTEAFKGYDAAGNANIYHALDYLNKKAKEQKERTK